MPETRSGLAQAQQAIPHFAHEVTLSEALKVACCARVLRIERSAGGVIRMACQIADFDFLAST